MSGVHMEKLDEKKIKIRRLNISDYDLCHNFYVYEFNKLENHLQSPHFSKQKIESALQTNGMVLGAFYESKLIAVCGISFDDDFEGKSEFVQKCKELSNCAKEKSDNILSTQNHLQKNECGNQNFYQQGVCDQQVKIALKKENSLENENDFENKKKVCTNTMKILNDVNVLEFSGFLVAVGYRKFGIAKKLFKNLIEILSERDGNFALCVKNSIFETQSAEFLSKLGFENLGRMQIKDYLFDYFVLIL